MWTWEETTATLRSFGRALADSTRTEDLIIVEQVTSRQAILRAAERMRRTPAGRRMLDERPQIVPAQVDYATLRRLPADTLGGAYVRHLDRNGLGPDLFARPNRFVPHPDADYLLKRYRQSHDVWHALTGLGVAPHQEVLIHAFTAAQLHLPYSWLIVSLGGIKHLIGEGRWQDLVFGLARAYRAGERAAWLLDVRWEDMWETPIADLRQRFRIDVLAGTDRDPARVL
jgi:ubiquinone biosynthesis protein COQ4